MVDARFLSSTDTEAKLPLLSIIVTSYTTKRLNDVLELLDSIKAQTYPNIETIFVAECSTELLDKVKAYASENNSLNLKVIFNDGEPGATSARNLGIREASGKFLAFIDDDAFLFPDWAKELVKTYEDSSIVGVTGPISPLWEDKSTTWFPTQFDWIIGCSRWMESAEMEDVRNVYGTNASFRRDALGLAGFYSVALGPLKHDESEWGELAEEAELSLRVTTKTGKRIVYNPGVRVYHKVPSYKLQWGFILPRAYQVGRTRHMLKALNTSKNNSTDVLSTEHQLLKRILTKLLPSILKGFFSSPVIAWRQLLVTITALFFVALGYYSHLFSSLLGHRKILVNKEKS